jgi:hypothetical protein
LIRNDEDKTPTKPNHIHFHTLTNKILRTESRGQRLFEFGVLRQVNRFK